MLTRKTRSHISQIFCFESVQQKTVAIKSPHPDSVPNEKNSYIKPNISVSPLSLSTPNLSLSLSTTTMGLKALFKGKKKKNNNNHQPPSSINSPTTNSLSPSLKGRCRLEEELEDVFKKFDANGDGRICAAELGSIMRSLGHAATEEELKTMIAEVDSDGDGFIDLREFIELNTNGIGHEEVIENLKDAFEVFDIDKNGSISAEELQNVLRSLGEDCTLAECRKMISGVDSDGNGAICFDEFKVMMIKGSRFDVNV